MPQIVSQTRFNDGTNDDILERKISFATAGVPAFIHKDLTDNVSSKNALSIAEYVLAIKTETNRKLELMAKRAREVYRYSIQYHHDARKFSDPLQYILKQFIIFERSEHWSIYSS